MRSTCRAAPGGKCRSRAPKKVALNPIRAGDLPRIGFVSIKPTYEKTYLVNPDDCGVRPVVLHHGGQGTSCHDHHDAFRNGGGTHPDEHEHDCDPSKRGRLLGRESELLGKGDALRLPFPRRRGGRHAPASTPFRLPLLRFPDLRPARSPAASPLRAGP